MKRIFLILVVIFFSCKKKDNEDVIYNSCSQVVSSYNDTLQIDKYKLFIISTISSTNTGAIEVIDKNNNNISGSADFSFNLVQLQNGNNCWETQNIQNINGTNQNSFNGIYTGIPDWAKNSKTQTIVKLTVKGASYYFIDK